MRKFSGLSRGVQGSHEVLTKEREARRSKDRGGGIGIEAGGWRGSRKES